MMFFTNTRPVKLEEKGLFWHAVYVIISASFC